MIYVGISTGWGYNFGGLGDFGWEMWQWRDFWYFTIFFSFVPLIWLLKKDHA